MESEHRIAVLEAKLAEAPMVAVSLAEVERLLDKTIVKLTQIDVSTQIMILTSKER